jgi:hypothetical protein
LQQALLDALREAVDQGEASPAHLAYLEDRMRVHAGQPQLYGTQFTVTGGTFGPYPIEDPRTSTSAAQQHGWNSSLTTRHGSEPPPGEVR